MANYHNIHLKSFCFLHFWNIQKNQQDYNKVMVNVDENYTTREVDDIQTKPYEIVGYKNKDSVYKL